MCARLKRLSELALRELEPKLLVQRLGQPPRAHFSSPYSLIAVARVV